MNQVFKIFALTEKEVHQIAASPNEPHNHDYEELIVVVEGKLEHFIDFKSSSFDGPVVSFVTKNAIMKNAEIKLPLLLALIITLMVVI